MKKKYFSLIGLVFLAALASILLACPTPTDPGTGNNPPTATFPPTGYQASSAGTGAVNGNYSQSGAFNGFPLYILTPGSYLMFNFTATDDMTRRWGIRTSTIMNTSLSDVAYYAPNASTPSEGVWTTGGGTNPAPNVLRMPISGSKNPWGGTLTGHYIFQDADGDTEGATNFQWNRFDNSTDTTGGTPIGTNSVNYTTVAGDDTKWLRIKVTPMDEHGTAGTPVLSPPIQVGTS